MEIGTQLFPTPEKIIKKMLEPYVIHPKNESSDRYQSYYYGINFGGKDILDPSAGTGALLSYIKDNEGNHTKNKLFAIEIDPVLNEALKGNYTVIGEDFLNYEGDMLFDLIVMNPPFAYGAKHLLKAWATLYKGDIVCLLNAETVLNPYTTDRKELASIIRENGSYEFLGPVFKNSENPTDVEVVMVRLEKTVNDKFDFDFDLRGSETVSGDLDEDTLKKDEVAVNDIIGSTVMQYEQLRDSYIDYLKAVEKLEYYSKGLLSEHTDIKEVANKSLDYKGDKKTSYNDFVSSIKSNAWKVVLKKSNIEKYMTTKVQNNFQLYISEKGNSPFTKENIFSVIRMIIQNRDVILEQAITDAFDMLTLHYEDNRVSVKNWKHNDAYKVNKKIIIPYYIRNSWENAAQRIEYGSTFSLNWSRSVNFGDVDKALCYITGTPFESITSVHGALERAFRLIGKVYKGPFPKFVAESTFFKMRFYIAGTIHLTWKDEKIREMFNIRAAKLKNWLPEREWDSWKAKHNRGEKRTPKSHQIEQTSLF